ncbi:TRAP transporter substrate-binding protein DctP [Virgibacillus oceani]
MRKVYVLLFLSIVLLLSACGDTDESGSQSTYIASTGYPNTDGSVDTFSIPILENVMEQSDAVDFDIFTGGELFDADDALDALNSESIDIEMVLSPTLDPQRFPYSSVVGLPLLESDASVAAEAIQKLVESDVEISDGKTYYELEFSDKDLFALPIHPTETYVISTAGTKLDTLDNFNQSVSIRASSNVHEMFINELGLSPVALPATEIYDGLSRGSIDGVMLNVPDWPPYGVDEQTDYTLTGLSLGHFPVFFSMKQETWDSFPDDVQEIFKEEASELIQSGPEVYKGQVEEILPEYEENGGELTEVTSLDAEVQDKINQAIFNTWENWIEDLESRDHAGKEIALLWRDLIVESGGSLPQEIMDME